MTLKIDGITLVDDTGGGGGSDVTIVAPLPVPVEIVDPLGPNLKADSVSVTLATDEDPIEVTASIPLNVNLVTPNPLPVQWGGTNISGPNTLNGAGQDSTFVGAVVLNAGSGVLEIFGNFVGTLVFEGVIDFFGTNWFSVPCFPIAINSNAPVTQSDGTTGRWWVPLAGLSQFRVRVTAYTSGSSDVTLQSNSASLTKVGPLIPTDRSISGIITGIGAPVELTGINSAGMGVIEINGNGFGNNLTYEGAVPGGTYLPLFCQFADETLSNQVSPFSSQTAVTANYQITFNAAGLEKVRVRATTAFGNVNVIISVSLGGATDIQVRQGKRFSNATGSTWGQAWGTVVTDGVSTIMGVTNNATSPFWTRITDGTLGPAAVVDGIVIPSNRGLFTKSILYGNQVDTTGAFTPASDRIQAAVAGVVHDAGGTVPDNRYGYARITGQRAWHTNLRTNAGVELLGQQLAVASIPVVLASDQPAVPISGSISIAGSIEVGVLNINEDAAYTSGDTDQPLLQTPDGRLRVAVAGLVSDVRESYNPGQVRALSLTTDGRLRAAISDSPSNLEFFGGSEIYFGSFQPYASELENNSYGY